MSEVGEKVDGDVSPGWLAIEDGLDESLLRADAGFDDLWSSYSGSSTSPGRCC